MLSDVVILNTDINRFNDGIAVMIILMYYFALNVLSETGTYHTVRHKYIMI